MVRHTRWLKRRLSGKRPPPLAFIQYTNVFAQTHKTAPLQYIPLESLGRCKNRYKPVIFSRMGDCRSERSYDIFAFSTAFQQAYSSERYGIGEPCLELL